RSRPRPVLRRRFRIRARPSALLFRRSLGFGSHRAPHHQSTLHAADGGLDAENRSARRGCEELEILMQRRSFLAAALAGGLFAQPAKRRFLIDTDTASDDAVAILMALQWPDV